MKTSIIFITLLFAVSCNIDSKSQTAFVELTKDARAEAVLATVAIQMQQNNGFDKVQSLLSELLNTARTNLHNNNMLNRKATARCDIYNHKLAERSEYLNSVVDALTAERATVVEAENHAGDAIQSRIALRKNYEALASSEKQRFQKEQSFYAGLRNTVNEALNNISDVAAKLKGPTPAPQATAFIQEGVKKVTDSYHKVFNMNIELPQSFVQMSIDNDAARRRIVQWLEEIRGVFAAMVGEVDDDDKERKENNGKFEALLEKICQALKAENENITTIKQKYASLKSNYDDNIQSFNEFKNKNAANLKENQEYCQAEQSAYEKVKANSESNVRIYEELMNYFLENYRKISKMINDKYKTLP